MSFQENNHTIILSIESSCDDTSAAILKDNVLLSNVISNQEVHKVYGGVVPELASRAHQQNIIPVINKAINDAGIKKEDINAIAFTRGPGLLGSLLVGSSFAKGFALARQIPLIEVNHLQAHILVHFIDKPNEESKHPSFPFLCLLVSGGHTQLVLVKDYLNMEIIGQTIDDAAGEAFDKCAKVMNLPYPGGPLIDKHAKSGNPKRFSFTKPRINDYNYSFSGLKTNFLYFLRDEIKKSPDFINENINDLCASLQDTIIEILLDKLEEAIKAYNIKEIALAGGVSANSGLREKFERLAIKNNLGYYIPQFSYTTDNAAMIGITGFYKHKQGLFASQDVTPIARLPI